MKTRIAVLVALAWTVAPAAAHAQGVTNPAKNPNPITVTIDGQTYTDGRDTLPGYDDVACTPIPGIIYDFENNQIQYNDSDGKLIRTANWTEWERISSYDDWVKSKTKPTPTATPVRTVVPVRTVAPVRTATPAPTTQSQQPTTTTTTQTQTQQTTAAAQNQAAAQNTATNTPSSSTNNSSTKKQSSSKSSSSNKSRSTSKSSSSSSSTNNSSSSSSPSSTSTPSSASTPASSSSSPAATGGDTTTTSSVDPLVPATDPGVTDDGGAPAPVDDGAVADIAGSAPVVAPDGTVTAPAPNGAQVVAAAGPGVASNLELASQTADLAFGDSPTRLAGVAILVALVAIGFFTLAFGEIRNQLFGRR